jgi:uncharacterized protein
LREPEAVLIAALSGRALAAAARRSGYAPLVADLFDDMDTRAIATRTLRVRGSLAQGFARAALLDALDRLADGQSVAGVAYGSGFEDRPSLLDALAKRVPLLGNSGRVVAQVKEPAYFAGICRKLGIPHPAIRLDGDAEAGWVEKRKGGSGGTHVKPARPGRKLRGSYWQRLARGRAASVLFLADGQRALTIGLSEQWCDPAPRHPFRYGGCARPAAIAPAQASDMQDAVSRLVRECGLVGLNSADFLLRVKGFDLLEINPRPGATLDIFRHPSLFRLHVEACRGRMPEHPPTFRGAAAAAEVYAPTRLCLRPGFLWPGWAADRQDPGKPVEEGEPLCTVLAQGPDIETARTRLRKRAQTILASAVT